MVGSIVVVGALTHCVLLNSMWDLKAAQMNLHFSLIWELIVYAFKLCHNAVKATKILCGTKDKIAIDHSTVTRWFKKFCSGFQNLDNQSSLKLWILRPCSKP